MVTETALSSQPAPPAGAVQPDRGRVRVRTLVITRWLAVGGQVGTLLVVSEGMQVDLPMLPAMAAVACSAALNVWLSLRRRLNGWHSESEAAAFLAYDIAQLAVLLFLTGGLENPFALLVLVPVTIAATIFSLGTTVALGLFSFVCVSVLFAWHMPLPWPEPGLRMPAVYKLAVWISLVLGMAFLMFYVWRVAEEARRMSDALAAIQSALSREQELSSLGALAAAAAHELGTPLGTIALVAGELSRQIGNDPELGDDIALLNSEAARCREILARLARNPRVGIDSRLAVMGIDALVAAETEAHQRDGVVLTSRSAAFDGSSAPPQVRRSAELVQGLGNLIENALEFARAQVTIDVGWSPTEVRLTISDDGPGFRPEVLEVIGEPYVSTRPDRGGMGLGVFISTTLLQRTGATVRIANRKRGRGAVVVITWPRSIIEVQGNAGR